MPQSCTFMHAATISSGAPLSLETFSVSNDQQLGTMKKGHVLLWVGSWAIQPHLRGPQGQGRGPETGAFHSQGLKFWKIIPKQKVGDYLQSKEVATRNQYGLI